MDETCDCKVNEILEAEYDNQVLLNTELAGEIDSLEKQNEALRRQVAEYKWAIGQVNRAIHNKEGNPKLKDETMSRQREEWATLWKALDSLLETYEKSYLQE